MNVSDANLTNEILRNEAHKEEEGISVLVDEMSKYVEWLKMKR